MWRRFGTWKGVKYFGSIVIVSSVIRLLSLPSACTSPAQNASSRKRKQQCWRWPLNPPVKCFGWDTGMRAEDFEHCSGESAFACAFMTLENENGLANLAWMLESVSKPANDVATGLWIACAKHTVDVIAHQLPTALARKYTEPAPQIETVAGENLRFVWSEGDAVVGQSVRIAQPELACRNPLHAIANWLPNVTVHVAMFEVLETLEGGDYHVAVDLPLLPRQDYALVAIVADDVVLLVE